MSSDFSWPFPPMCYLVTLSRPRGVNFINVLRAAFTRPDPKWAKRQSSHQCLFALLGPTRVKASCKMLMKLILGVSHII